MMAKNKSEELYIARRRARKKSELSLALPALGICMLFTPLINAFTVVDGIPNILSLLSYIFGIWGLLILGAYFAAKLLVNEVPKD